MQNPQYADYYPHTGDWCLYCINVPLHVQSIMSFFLRFRNHAVDGIAVHLEGSAIGQTVYQDEGSSQYL